MKKTTITLSYDEEKLNALRLYIDQKNTQIESELESALDVLYQKHMPSGVREYIDMRSGTFSAPAPKARRSKSVFSAVGTSETEVKE
ncbi:MAG: hypothetical protein HFE63_06910 [Clostridiales bacterium]|nr:hypothetical protein [Clostridiales bacterium]